MSPKTNRGNLPPHSREAEEHVLACCLLDVGETLERCRREGIASESFFLPQTRRIFEVLLAMQGEGKVIALEILAEELRARGELEKIGGFPYLSQVTGNIPTTAHAGYFIAKVREYFALRRIERLGVDLLARVSEFNGDMPSLLLTLQESAAELAENSAPAGLRTAAEICAKPTAQPSELIHGVLYGGGTMMLSGPSKARKTYTFLDLGLSVSSGSPWLGFKTSATAVLYLNFELAAHSFDKRVAAICSTRRIAPPAEFLAKHLRGERVTVPSLRSWLPRLIKKHRVGLVIVDPWYKLAAVSGAEENSNDGQARILSEVENIICGAGAALVVGHHFTKGDASAKNSIDRAAGAGAMARWGDVIATLTPHKEEGAMALEFHLRDFAPIDPAAIRWSYPVWERDQSLDPPVPCGVGIWVLCGSSKGSAMP